MWTAPNRNRRGPHSIRSRPHTNWSRPHRIQPGPSSIRRRPHRIRRAPCINRSGANRIRTGQHTIQHLRTGSGPRHQVGSAGPLHHGLRPPQAGPCPESSAPRASLSAPSTDDADRRPEPVHGRKDHDDARSDLVDERSQSVAPCADHVDRSTALSPPPTHRIDSPFHYLQTCNKGF